jgi:hypothetical protein
MHVRSVATACLLSFAFLLSDEPLIDVVYTWVDGSDLQWQAMLTEQLAAAGLPPIISKRRFRSRDELRYSLRSLYAFAPWVHHIYIVTCGQRPKWLKDDPKISIVDHKKIFLNPSHLPTFNSMAIECHLHRVPGLQEYYLYFNDDVFLGKESLPKDFFTKKGKMKFFIGEKKIPTSPVKPGEEGFFAGLKNTSALMASRFGAKDRPMHAHTAFSERVSFVSQVEMQFPEIFSLVSSHKFRSLDDYTITNGLIPLMALHTGQGVRITESRVTIGFGRNLEQNKVELSRLLTARPRFFCIQDSSDEESSEASSMLHAFFESYFPQMAPWEDPLFMPSTQEDACSPN